MQTIDIVIIVMYMVAIVTAGLMISKHAGKNIKSYFLGGNRIPWYYLGVANASGMFDITGTMWMVTLLFIYGLKSAWIPWLWPTFNQIVLMVYLSVWLRRSNVMTGAEWIITRFGYGRGAELSHISVVFFALVSSIGFLAYAFQGIGKFAAIFFPWDLDPNTYAVIFMSITTAYIILGGIYSVVLTDIIQFILMTVASIAIAVIAISRTSAEAISAVVPDGWHNLFFGWKLDLDWSGLIDSVNAKIATDGYSLFGIFFMMILFKGVLASMAGPTPNYDMQKILSTRSPRESALMSWFTSTVLFIPRYLLIAGTGVLALVYFKGSALDAMGSALDFEQILPYVINNFLPAGLVGLVLAGLLAAFMSTFTGTVNAGASYMVNDIYKRYINPRASDRRYVVISYFASILIVIVGISFGFMTESINSVLQWLVAGLYGGYIAPNLLKWHWWRFNGHGYFGGMIAGIGAALIFPVIFPDMSALTSFPFILLLSILASVIVSLLTPPDSKETLKSFYRQVRPWGFWDPILAKVQQDDPDFERNTAFKRDAVNVAVGIVWQLLMFVIPIYLVIREYRSMWIAVVLLALTSIFLKQNWYNKLEKD